MAVDPPRRENTPSTDALAGVRSDVRASIVAIAGLAARLAEPDLESAARAEAASAVRKQCRRLLRLLGEPTAHSGARRPHVLVAEDCPDSRQAVCSLLAHNGFDVTPAENGRVAVALSLAGNYDLILLDMQMPELDGYAAARQLRHSGFGGPVIALTGDVRPGDEQACHDAGCDTYLAKPWEPDHLLRVLRGHLGAGRPSVTNKAKQTTPRADPTVQQVAREFARGLPNSMAEMAAALASENRRQAARIAHQIAGAAGLFGFPEVCRMARGLEAAANEAGAGDAELEERLRELADLSQRIARGSGSNP
jgi:CheY-like chemotaxis protein